MTYAAHGQHLIAGHRVASETTFASAPATGEPQRFSRGDSALVDAAAKAAEAAFAAFSATPRDARATFLDTIAAELEARAEPLIDSAAAESGLPTGRLEGELARTAGQLRLFAGHIRKGAYLDRVRDPAQPDRQPASRPDLRMMQRPVGPVAVFGASNFPLAFSVAGGDTASALAAGCPVVFKGHEAHPATSEIAAEAIVAAAARCAMPEGCFSLVHGGSHEVGAALVTHPLIRAVGFTGSLAGGRALYDLCARRPDPIPFFGELGSVNPMFLLPGALDARGDEIAAGWAGSLTLGAGQFCTNPGIVVVLKGAEETAFTAAALARLAETGPQVMLTDGIAQAYRAGAAEISATAGVQDLLTQMCDRREARPFLFRVAARDWLANRALSAEVFGPLGLIVVADDTQEMLRVASSLEGQLTASLHIAPGDEPLAAQLMPVLERKAGRIIVNGFPTGVEVSDAMVHGGPYPASTNFGATSVGSMAIRRFLRLICYQSVPEALLPEELRGGF